MAMKTPGVYVVEKNAFPNSIVEVATAVPAFIGYTELALDGGTDLGHKPWRISSMAEYERYFGGPPQPAFTIKIVDPDLVAKVADLRAAATKAASDAAAEIAELVRPQADALSKAAGELDAARKELAEKPEDLTLQARLRQKNQAHEAAKAAKAAAERRATPTAAAAAAFAAAKRSVKEAQAALAAANLKLPPAEEGKPAPVAGPEQKAVEEALARLQNSTR